MNQKNPDSRMSPGKKAAIFVAALFLLLLVVVFCAALSQS
jgi:hypothetical protein